MQREQPSSEVLKGEPFEPSNKHHAGAEALQLMPDASSLAVTSCDGPRAFNIFSCVASAHGTTYCGT